MVEAYEAEGISKAKAKAVVKKIQVKVQELMSSGGYGQRSAGFDSQNKVHSVDSDFESYEHSEKHEKADTTNIKKMMT